MATDIPLDREPVETVPTDPIDRVIHYHVQTKRHFNRYARALGYLQWANQPDPFTVCRRTAHFSAVVETG